MEIFELRYFLAVAQIENLNRAARDIHVSAGSLSKAISRLEDELQTPLFFRSGRGIRLTAAGKILKTKAASILQLEEDSRLEITGREAGSLNVFISSAEYLHASFGTKLIKVIDTHYPRARTQFRVNSDEKSIEQVIEREVQLALVTLDIPPELTSIVLSRVNFTTCASPKHPLLKTYSRDDHIPVAEILKYAFVSPDRTIFGNIGTSTSFDGWRDDKFPRNIKYRTDGLRLMENMIHAGLALGYLPDPVIESADLIPLRVSGCRYSCSQTVRLIAKDPTSLGWLNRLWDEIRIEFARV